MNKLSLTSCQLFEGMTLEQIDAVLESTNYEQRIYSIREVIVPEGNRLSSLMILTKGSLVAENPEFPPMQFRGEELEHIHILGRAVQVVGEL